MTVSKVTADLELRSAKFRSELDKAIAKQKKFEQGSKKAATGAGKFDRSMRGAARGVASINGPLGGVASRITALNGIVGSGTGLWLGMGAAIAGLTFIAAKSVMAFSEIESSQLRTQALLKSTGLAAGRTAEQLDEQARAIARGTLASTQAIRHAQQILLTFRTVQEENFDRAIALSQDLADVLGTQAKDAALQLGKALEDPATGLTALRRSGISFTESQKDMIKTMTEAGEVAAAQSMILDTLENQIGGAAEGAAGGVAGKTDGLAQEWEELMEAFAQTGPANMAVAAMDGMAEAINRLRRVIAPTVHEEIARIDAMTRAANIQLTVRERIEGESQTVARLREELVQLSIQRHEQIKLLALTTEGEREAQAAAAEGAAAVRAAAEEERGLPQNKPSDKFVGPLQQTQAELQAEADKISSIILMHRAKLTQIREDQLGADDRLRELEHSKHQRQLEDLEQHVNTIREAGFTNAQIEADIMAAREQLESAHQARLTQIQEDENEERLKGQLKIFDILAKGAMAADKQRLAFGISVAKELFDTKKMEAIKEAIIAGKVAIQQAWASSPFPSNIPAVAITAAQTAGNIATIRGVAHAGIDNIPREGTYLLDGGESVLQPAANRDLRKFLNKDKEGGSGTVINIINNAPVTVSARDAGVDENGTRQYEVLINSMRQAIEGGELDGSFQAFGMSRANGGRG